MAARRETKPPPTRRFPDPGQQDFANQPNYTSSTMYSYQSRDARDARDARPIDVRAQGLRPDSQGGKMLRINRAQSAYKTQRERQLQSRPRGGRARGLPARARMVQRQGQPTNPDEIKAEKIIGSMFGTPIVDEESPAPDTNSLPTLDEIAAWMGDPPQSRNPVPYDPEPITIESLREDWPAVPSSFSSSSSAPISLSEGIEEQLRWLSRRFAHSHLTTMQLAERLFKGELVHFHSVEEQKEVEELAREMAEERAQKLSERANASEERKPISIGFRPLEEEERRTLAKEMIKGGYEDRVAPSAEGPVMQGIMQKLRNNGTYGMGDTEKFRGKLGKVLGGGNDRRARGPQQVEA